MTNGEKFITPDERKKAYAEFCMSQSCKTCALHDKGCCRFFWLTLKYESRLKPCPFCGEEAEIIELPKGGLYRVQCKKRCCIKVSAMTKSEAIEAWNRRKS